MTVVAPVGQPWDLTAIVEDALSILRLTDSDTDAGRVTEAAPVATSLVDQELDAVEPYADAASIPASVVFAAVLLTVEMYRRKDAPFGVLNAWSVDDVQFRIGADAMRSTRSLLLPYKARFGVA